MKTVCIIGGGFSGTATAIQLLETAADVQIKLINDTYPPAQGIAYSTSRYEHLLNVPAGRMSLFPQQPDHFINWLKARPDCEEWLQPTPADAFVPRALYGIYMKELLELYTKDARLELITARAIKAEKENDGYSITLAPQQTIHADALVLAMGNYQPAPPRLKDANALQSTHYYNNPWDDVFLKGLKDTDSILLIGTGLTMVDCVLSLRKENFGGKIIVASPRGYLPESHTTPGMYPDFYEEYKGKPLDQIFRTVRTHIKDAIEKKIAWQAVIDSLRLHVQSVWQQMSKEEKQQFTSHLRHIWGVARHRLPESTHAQIHDSMDNGHMQIIGGRIVSVEENKNGFTVGIRPRREQSVETYTVARIVNCTGPQINYEEINDPFVKSLINNGIIYTDTPKMGVSADPDGKVLDKDGKPVKNVYTLGSLLRGVLWETTAVPDIRTQAEHVARQISE